jgi:hypothetical protein
MAARTVKVDRTPFRHYIRYGEGDDMRVKPIKRMANLNMELRRLGNRGVRNVVVTIDLAASDVLSHNASLVYEGHPHDVREHLRNPLKGL